MMHIRRKYLDFLKNKPIWAYFCQKLLEIGQNIPEISPKSQIWGKKERFLAYEGRQIKFKID